MMDLKPCPFCGSDDVGLYVCGGEPEERESFFVICNSCHGSTGEYRTRELAQSIWNTRASDT